MGITFRRGRYRVRVTYQGRMHEIGTFESLRLAKLAHERYKAEAILGTFVSPADQRREQKRLRELNAVRKMTVSEWSTLWLQGLEEADTPRSAGTITSYESTLNAHIRPAIGTRPLVDVTKEDIDATINAAKKSGTSAARNVYRTLRAMFNSAAKVQAGGLETSPVAAGKLPTASRARTDAETPTAEEITKIANLMPDQYRLAVELAAWCSLRIGEVLGLQRGDFAQLDDPDMATLRVERQWASKTSPPSYQDPKDDSTRTVAVPPFLVPKIVDHLARFTARPKDSPVFPSPQNNARPTSHNTLGRHWQNARATVHPRLAFHSLRHAGLTAYAQAGATLRETMERGGHRDVSASMRYQHANLDRDRQIARELSDRLSDPKAWS